LKCKLDSSEFEVDIEASDSVSKLKKKIKDEKKNMLESIDADNLILVRVFETEKNIGIPNSSKTKDLIESLVNDVRIVDLPEQTEYEDNLPGFEWTSGKVSAKVLNSGGRCSTYGLTKDSFEFTVDILIILPLVQQGNKEVNLFFL
ncbi:hypothetical protein HK096_004293, partial [Nowakowskiella sp. JEL0078]